jgi:hypothetical protein
MHQVKAVVFDVFGTLVRIGVKRRPYIGLQQLLKARDRPPKADDIVKIIVVEYWVFRSNRFA